VTILTNAQPDDAWADRIAPLIDLDDLTGPHPAAEPVHLQQQVTALLEAVAAVAADVDVPSLHHRAEAAVTALATPPGALGRLGEVAIRLAAASGHHPPAIPARPALVVAAGDHGVHAQGVSPWPQTISGMVASLLAQGRAGASALAVDAGARTVIMDVGLATTPPAHPRLLPATVATGTRDLREEDALTPEQVDRALLVGVRVTEALIGDGTDLIALGDVGIANTTASSALIASLTSTDPDLVTGRGSGIDDATLALKREVVRAGVARAGTRAPLGYLAAFGGAEHAALVGVILAASRHRVPVVLDGVVTGAAALVATALAPGSREVLLAGHRSAEPGATVALDALGMEPLLDLSMRLGEGSGALAAIPLVRGAARLLHQVATLDEALGTG